MRTGIQTASPSAKMRWAGRIMSALVVLFLVFDGVIKLVELPVVGETMQQLGYPPSLSRGLGLLTLVITALYALPRTSILGAILLTGLIWAAQWPVTCASAARFSAICSSVSISA